MTGKQTQGRSFYTSSPVVSMDFSSAFSLANPHVENTQTSASSRSPIDTETFGLFGGESQYNNFAPGTSEEDWKPEESDFIYPEFRLLSEVTVVKFGIPIHFSSAVLSKAVKKALGQTVYPDHKNDEVGNSLGVVYKTFWQDAYEADGVKVPAGINGILKIDAKSNPRIARAILMNPPAIHSGSIKVSFQWEKSHDLSDEDFWNKVGTYTEDGELIRLNVTDIPAFMEYSLVTHGADRFAQKVENGKIVNPKYSEWTRVFNQNSDSALKYDLDYRSNSSIALKVDPINYNPNTLSIMNIIQLLNSKLPEDLQLSENASAEEVVSLYETLAQDKDTLTQEKSTLEARVTELEDITPISEDQAAILSFVEERGGIDKVTSTLKDGEAYLNQVRASAIAQYKLANADNIQELIVQNIENASLETAKAFEVTYSAQVEKVLPLKCEKCGSHEVSRSSHKKDGEEFQAQEEDINRKAEKESSQRRRKMSDIHK